MNPNRLAPRHAIRSATLLAAVFQMAPASRGADLIDNDFGVGADTGPAFQQLYNGQGTASADPTTGTITTTGIDNAAIGLNTAGTVDASAASEFTIEWVVSSFTGDSFNDGSGSRVRFNGWFFGVTTNAGNAGPALWNNTGEAVGILLDGGNTYTDWSFVQRTGGSLNANTSLNGSQPTVASFNDGFTLSLTINADDTWSASSTGLSNDISSSGSLAAGTYATIAGSLVANTTIQGTQVGYVLDRVTLETISSDTSGDNTPPTPAQMSWTHPPSALSETEITMTAVTADDDNGVQYQFTRWFDGSVQFTSDWQGTPGFTDSGLLPATTYGYTVVARDRSVNQNTNTESSPVAEATTNDEGTDPPPNGGYVAPFVDSDGDSYRDEAETALGSDPNDPADCPDHTPAPAMPNIVIIYADDLGFGDISRYGNLFGTTSASPTPNVDSLADQGVTFTQAHSANAVCTPSRYSLLTGIYNWRNFQSISGHYGYKAGIDNIPLDGDVTIADFLKTQGYDTAAFGKWHLGGKWYAPGTNNRITGNPTDPSAVDWTRRIEGHATDIGFDYFRGLGTVLNMGPYVYLHDDIVHYWVEDTALNTYGDKLPNGRKGYFRPATAGDSFQWFTSSQLNSTVVAGPDSRESLGDPSYRQIDAGPIMIADFESYIANRTTTADTDPFFAYVSLYSPHKPWAITPAFNNSTYGDYDYARWMAEVDDRIGRIIAAIDDNGMANDTLVIFTADNGPETTAMDRTLSNGDDANGPLRGAKRDVWDGGTRVPFIVRWPGQAPAGMVVTDELISQVDIFPTIAAFLGQELPDTTAPDGESFLNVVRGQRKPGEARSGIVLCSFGGHLALKAPDGWKLIDSTGGGGNTSSWDSENNSIPSAIGTNQGVPKQLFEMPVDLGEDINRIDSLTGDSAIRAELVNLTGRDLLATLDQLRTSGAAALDGREPDNDADGMSNAFETLHGLDRDSPKDAALDNDGDGADNLSESIAGTDPNDRGSVFRVIDLTDSAATLSVTWPSVADRTYEVFWSTDLGVWTSDSIHPGTGEEITVPLDKAVIDAADGNSGNLRALFVRIGVTRS
ncbi:sulfatase-like hydrolase/transferase [Haloferula sp. A504]|uniref:sulfatase-like hydrolase/transferase n=1 Tax=Haloferula sp. A504 TaxID=3373601 RepID=UPI0031BF810A|nr:sulfatase-like hydrolase/transferase [Verrucomicrobiaceae bacterium E54]